MLVGMGLAAVVCGFGRTWCRPGMRRVWASCPSRSAAIGRDAAAAGIAGRYRRRCWDSVVAAAAGLLLAVSVAQRPAATASVVASAPTASARACSTPRRRSRSRMQRVSMTCCVRTPSGGQPLHRIAVPRRKVAYHPTDRAVEDRP